MKLFQLALPWIVAFGCGGGTVDHEPTGDGGAPPRGADASEDRLDGGGAGAHAGDVVPPAADAGEPGEIALTIDPDRVEEDLVDFPLLVHLAAASGAGGADLSFVFDELPGDEDRQRIAFSASDGTPLFAEIERWDGESREAWIWVKVPLVSSTEETVLRLRYGGNLPPNVDFVGDTASEPATQVWTHGFVAVYHFAEEADGTPGEYLDSTANGIHGTGGAGTASAAPGSTDGRIGAGPDFDGRDDFIELPDHDGFSQPTTGALSISFWFSRDVLDYPGRDYIRMIGKGIAGQAGAGGPNNHEWTFNFYNDSLPEFPARRQRRSFYVCDYESGQCAGDYAQPGWEPYGPIPYYDVRTWTYYVGQLDDTYVYAYSDGILGHRRVNYRTYGDNRITPRNENAPVRLGTRDTPASSGILDGRLDEFRISGVFRSPAWIRADHLCQADTLVDYAPVGVEPTP